MKSRTSLICLGYKRCITPFHINCVSLHAGEFSHPNKTYHVGWNVWNNNLWRGQTWEAKRNPWVFAPPVFSAVFFVLPSLIIDNSCCLHRNNENLEWKVSKGHLQKMRDNEFWKQSLGEIIELIHHRIHVWSRETLIQSLPLSRNKP